jgi:uncharacterized protein YcbK (DUF882 family)
MSNFRSKYFKRKEFACKCGCGFDTIDFELVRILEEIRDHFDRPVIVNSGCRCAFYNSTVGGSKNSMHVKGRAADITVEGVPPDVVAELADQMDVGGRGKYDTFTHVDTRAIRARWEG